MDDQLRSRLRCVSFDQQWSVLREIIIGLYVNQDLSLPKLAEKLKADYGFNAHPPQYRYRLKSWGIRKNIKAVEKTSLVKHCAKRAHNQISTSGASLFIEGQWRPMNDRDKKRVRRHIRDQIGHAKLPTLAPGSIIRWSLPYPALSSLLPNLIRNPSQPGSPSAIFASINSPPAGVSPRRSPSPTKQLIIYSSRLEQVDILIQGRYRELLGQLEPLAQRETVNYFNDLFMFGFMSAKYRGLGPTQWTSDLISTRRGVLDFAGSRQPSPDWLADWVCFPPDEEDTVSQPTQLCQWSIHTDCGVEEEYDEECAEQDIADVSTWKPWIEDDYTCTLSDQFMEAVADTHPPSKTPSIDLPFSSQAISKALERSPQELEAELFVLAIMAGNFEYIDAMLSLHETRLRSHLARYYPFHLAASHLNGAESCCCVMDSLVNNLQCEASIGKLYRNDLGHTVLDSLMITIIRSHTSLAPTVVSEAFQKDGRFPGESVDVCGRWDMDASCVRELHDSGQCSIPMSWKHPFCHSSAQAVCHSITAFAALPHSPDINTVSGIFLRTCAECQETLTPEPLHILVIVAYHLARSGTPGETLFGAIAVLVCLLVHGADPTIERHLSASRLFVESVSRECDHSSMTPHDLAARVPPAVVASWAPSAMLGWRAFVEVLGSATHQRYADRPRPNEKHIHYSPGGRSRNLSCLHSGQIGQLWAAVQAELLTYRRLNDGDPWLSSRFDLGGLLKSLHSSYGRPGVALLDEGVLKPYSDCGWYRHGISADRDTVMLLPRATEICTSDFTNLRDWGRTTLLPHTTGMYYLWRY